MNRPAHLTGRNTGVGAALTGSVPLAQRAGGPDLARGLALLGIALANTVGWLHGQQWTVLLKQADASILDRIADVLIALIADNRGFPLFALLFGYGIGILYRRSAAAGERPGRFVIRMLKRHVVLAAIGLAHGIFLFSGDILVDYAMIGMLCVLLVTRRPIALLLAAAITTLPLALWGWADGVIGLGDSTGYAAASAPTYLAGLEIRFDDAVSDLAFAFASDIGLLCPMAIGAILARIHLLEQVEQNRDLLRPFTRYGLLIGLFGAVPLVAVLAADPHLQVVTSATVLGILGLIHQLSGVVGAVGIVAACALLADRARMTGQPRSAVTTGPTRGATEGAAWAVGPIRAIEALGAMALTAYVAQSVVFLALFPPYTGDLGGRIGTFGASVIVLATWLVLLVAATLLRRVGRRGPLEFALRRLAGSTQASTVQARAVRRGAVRGRSSQPGSARPFESLRGGRRP